MNALTQTQTCKLEQLEELREMCSVRRELADEVRHAMRRLDDWETRIKSWLRVNSRSRRVPWHTCFVEREY